MTAADLSPLAADSRAAIEADHRIPVTSSHPSRCFYIASLDERSVMPTELELKALRSFIVFGCGNYYNETWQAKMLAMDLAGDDGHNTVTFLKRAEGDWAYRRWTWTQGPTYFPMVAAVTDYPRQLLVDCMDHAYDLGGPHRKWEAWKAEHTNVLADPALSSRQPILAAS